MGCTPFTEHWDKSLDDLIIDAAQLTYASAGIHQDDIGALVRHLAVRSLGLAMGGPLKIPASRSPAPRTTVRPAPRRCGRRPTPWRPAPTTS